MESGWTQELLNWLNAHPGWGFITVLLVAFFESLVLIGILLPGMFILFGVGALIGLGVLDMLPIWIAATVGAFLGDSFSYLLGHRFRGALVDIWPFSRYPGLIERGTHFFHRHGAKSIMAGRFVGPLRPIIPAVGGMMGMKPSRFLAVDIPACILWAPAFLIPGILFGASLEVASQYTGRLTVMLIILVVLLWLTWWAIRAIYEPLASRSARWFRHFIRWSRRHPLLGRVAGPLIDPSRPEALSVTMMGILLVIVFWGLIMLLFMSPFSAQPQALDQAVRDLALSLRNHLADPVMVAVSQLSRWQVSVFSALALLLWLIGAGRKQAAVHWLIAIGGGSALHLLLSWSLRTTPEVLELADRVLMSPSAAMSLTTVVLTFFAVMEASELQRKHRQWPYLAAAVILLLLGMSRIYLGLEWLSGALMGVTAGLAWTAVVGFAYRQRAMRHFSGGMASLIFYGSLTALFTWQVNVHTEEDMAALQSTTLLQEVAADSWWESGWRDMAMNRTRLSSVASQRFNAQVAAEPEVISHLLQQHDWEKVPDTDWRWFLQALNPEPDQVALPLLGRAYQGSPEVLLLKKNIGDNKRLLTVRLWDSGVRLMPGGQVLYLGQVAEEVLDRRFGLFSYWRAVPVEHQLIVPIQEALAPLEQKAVREDLILFRD
ncbi:MAG: VTT domain-containing protein [Xanthomonadales bacterium]|nr:VTT domain-containing protein [Xanthomonadales bacterium]